MCATSLSGRSEHITGIMLPSPKVQCAPDLILPLKKSSFLKKLLIIEILQ